MAQIPLPLRLQAHARFSTFVPGGNPAVLDHLRQAGTDGRADVLWIWGPPGSGKSHLLQAACASATEGGRRAMYLPMASLGSAQPALLDGLDTLDLLAVDDVEQVMGEAEWDRALFGLYNELVAQHACLLMAASQPPTAVPFSLPDLASRAAGAVVYRLSPLGDGDTVAALQGHAQHRGLELPEAAARYLMNHVERNMTALCDWLDTLDEASLAAKRRLTVPFIRDVLGPRPS